MKHNLAISRDVTLFLTRMLVAGIFLWHGVPKAFDTQMAIDKFVGFGLPGMLGPVTGVVEVAAALLLIAGVAHRWVTITLAAIITGAIVTVQLPAGITAPLERDLLILAATLVLLAQGRGRLLRVERHHGIDAECPPRRNVTSE